MNEARNSKIDAQVEGYVSGCRERLRYKSLPYGEAERLRDIMREKREFEDAQRIYHWCAVEWIGRGLRVLAEDGYGLDVQFHKSNRQAGHDDLVEALECAIEDTLEEDDLDDYLKTTPEEIALTRAWCYQSDYEVYVRARLFEQLLKDYVGDYALDFAAGDGPSLNKFGEELWAKIVQAWVEDLREQKPDRVMNGEVIR